MSKKSSIINLDLIVINTMYILVYVSKIILNLNHPQGLPISNFSKTFLDHDYFILSLFYL